MGRIECSLAPRLTTMLTLTGKPASAAASMPSSTLATGKRTSFIAWNTPSSSESRLTVTRSSPAARSAGALARSSDPLVVSVRSDSPSARSSAEHRHQVLDAPPQQRLAAGDPDLLDAQADRQP